MRLSFWFAIKIQTKNYTCFKNIYNFFDFLYIFDLCLQIPYNINRGKTMERKIKRMES